MKKIIFSIVIVLTSITYPSVYAQEDTVKTTKFKKYWNSLINGNVDRTFEQKMDISFVIAPCYTREGNVGIGGAATALYRLDKRDSIMQPSDFSFSGSATVKGFYGITLKGNNHFKGNRSRLSYLIQFQNKNLDFWGISYEACARNSMSGYKRQMINWESDYIYKLTAHFHIGAALNKLYQRIEFNESDLLGRSEEFLFSYRNRRVSTI